MIENRAEILRPCIDPFTEIKTAGPDLTDHLGRRVCASFGMHEDGYDIRLRDATLLIAGRMVFGLALERLSVPRNLRARCDDKSTNLRLGLRVAGRAAPGWHGHLTLELMYIPVEGGPSTLMLPAGWGVATLEFQQLAREGDYGAQPNPKYQGATEIQSAR